ncbi:MAG: type III-B CRISPR module RAMP protein Cmr6 [bacterium]
MSIIPGCKWIKENTTTLNRIIQDVSENKVNASLILDKFITWESIDFNKKRSELLDKKSNFKKIKPIINKTDDYEQFKGRKNLLPGLIKFILVAETCLIVNHGGESVLDNSIAIHPYYGFPVIPASAIKGVTRHFCGKEFKHLSEDEILKIFGNNPGHKNANEGSVVFLDAWPVKSDNPYELDIFTPHYQEYYNGNDHPKDNQSPIPIPFLSVKKDIEFEFAIAPSSNCKELEVNEFLNEVKELIIQALTTFGIGAKTGSNYGYFERR